MRGSEAEIARAEKIKSQILQMLQEMLDSPSASTNFSEAQEVRFRSALTEAADQQDSAEWWIKAMPNDVPIHEIYAAIHALKNAAFEIILREEQPGRQSGSARAVYSRLGNQATSLPPAPQILPRKPP